MKFSYRAFDISGKEHRDVVESTTIHEAEETLRRGGLFVAEIAARGLTTNVQFGESRRWSGLGGRGKTARMRDVSVFLRQLSVLVSTVFWSMSACISSVMLLLDFRPSA